MPSRGGDAVAGDGQRNKRQEGGRRIGPEQLPLPLDDQADQDRERQRQNRDAVQQIHQIGLGGRQDSDDLGDGLLECDPLVSGDQRAGDHRRQKHRREDQSQDVVGPPGQWLKQAARHRDVAPVNSHVPRSSDGPQHRSCQRLAVNLARRGQEIRAHAARNSKGCSVSSCRRVCALGEISGLAPGTHTRWRQGETSLVNGRRAVSRMVRTVMSVTSAATMT